MSSNVLDLVALAVDYGTEHLGRSIAASDIDVIRATIRRRFMARIAMASWKGYANLILDRIKYVGAGSTTNRTQWRHHMLARGGDRGDFDSFSFAHETDRAWCRILVLGDLYLRWHA